MKRKNKKRRSPVKQKSLTGVFVMNDSSATMSAGLFRGNEAFASIPQLCIHLLCQMETQNFYMSKAGTESALFADQYQ